MENAKIAKLVLEDGTVFPGYSFGYDRPVRGEVVFNTAMTGYTESLTDPSYRGQIIAMTYPLVGNYGVPSREKDANGIPKWLESGRIHSEGIIVTDYSEKYSHWNAVCSLGDWLKEEKVVGLTGIDTRALAKHLRAFGSMSGTILIEGQEAPTNEREDVNHAAAISVREPITYGSGSKKVVLVDCGMKANILRQFIRPELTTVVVPWDYDFNTIAFDGLFFSNGPGDPTMLGCTVAHLRRALNGTKPIYGICMGNQLLSQAAGAKIFKLKYGHRSHNQPVRMVGTDRCFVTSQNHGYAVDPISLDKDWIESFVNLNDGTNEGIKHRTKPFFSVQFHPEACGGPTDTMFIFDDFLKSL